MFCHVSPQQVLGVHNVSSTYHVPLLLREQGLIQLLQKRLSLTNIKVPPKLKVKGEEFYQRWRDMAVGAERFFDTVPIVLVGKYTTLEDSYMSVVKALEHASMRVGRKLKLSVRVPDPVPKAELTSSGLTRPLSSRRWRRRTPYAITTHGVISAPPRVSSSPVVSESVERRA